MINNFYDKEVKYILKINLSQLMLINMILSRKNDIAINHN